MSDGEVRIRPSKYGFTCRMEIDGREYIGHGTTMPAAYEAFIQHGSEVLAEEQELTYFEHRTFMLREATRANKRPNKPDVKPSKPSDLTWWQRLIKWSTS